MRAFDPQVAQMRYEIVNENCGAKPNAAFDVDQKGVISTGNEYDYGTVQMNSVEDGKIVWKKRILIQVRRVRR